eukprot:TRINITY_DN31288_c0_g1_i1.p1 TRINITY_DN31288_c0_g1~~TRINITY_DN31288_c0_g1_i1.p1  ORF type:complete len:447 (+),score=66.05 TRINITY_DN31288_c0_g1_i1:37-1341(+)
MSTASLASVAASISALAVSIPWLSSLGSRERSGMRALGIHTKSEVRWEASCSDMVFGDRQLLTALLALAGLPAARCLRAARRTLGGDLSSAMSQLYASALPSIYMLGGASRTVGVLSTVLRLDAGSHDWKAAPPLLSPRRLCSATACDGSLYIIGGETLGMSLGMSAEYVQVSTADRFDPLQGEWTQLPPMPTARAGCASTTAERLIYVCGGRNCATVLSVVERFDPTIQRWERLPGLPTARSGCAAATVRGHVYVMGGKCGNSRVQGRVERFDPTFGRWAKLPSMISPRSALVAAAIGDMLFAVGGFNGSSALASTECFDPSSGVWALLPSLLAPRVGGAAAVAGGRLYVFGGKSSHSGISLCGECYNPLDGSWSKTPQVPDRQVYCAGAAAVSACSPFSRNFDKQDLELRASPAEEEEEEKSLPSVPRRKTN